MARALKCVAQRRYQRLDHIVVIDAEYLLELILEMAVDVERLLLQNADVVGALARYRRGAGVDEVAGLANAEGQDRDREVREADVAQTASATDADPRIVRAFQFGVNYREPFIDALHFKPELGQHLA